MYIYRLIIQFYRSSLDDAWVSQNWWWNFGWVTERNGVFFKKVRRDKLISEAEVGNICSWLWFRWSYPPVKAAGHRLQRIKPTFHSVAPLGKNRTYWPTLYYRETSGTARHPAPVSRESRLVSNVHRKRLGGVD